MCTETGCLNELTGKYPKLKIVLSKGEKGIVFHNSTFHLTVPLFPIVKEKIVNTIGAGDSFCGGFLFSLITNKSTKDSIETGLRCSLLSLQTAIPVSEEISVETVLKQDENWKKKKKKNIEKT